MGTAKRNSAGAELALVAILALGAPAAWGQVTASDSMATDAITPENQAEVSAAPAENLAPAAEPVTPTAPTAPDPVSSPIPAEDPSAELALKIKQLDAGIAMQKQRRSSAKAGFVMGGVVILGGIIATAVQTANEEEERAEQTGQYSEEVSINWTGFGIGLLIAAPIIAGSVSTLRDANRQANELYRQRRGLTLTSERDGMRLNLAFSF